MDKGPTAPLTAPEPELEALSFALPDPESVSEWIGRLPMANVSETAGQIRQATFEIARLDTDWSSRMALLEGIRPTVLYLASRLDRAANGAGNHADGIARLAQRLHSNLVSGYNAVILQGSGDDKARRTVSLAIHRALSDLSRTLLRTLQYYVAPTDNLWLKLNRLYWTAEQIGATADPHEEPDGNETVTLSVAGAYLRSLLLGLARPYQLRHRQLSDVFQALPGWVGEASLDAPGEDDLYRVDLGSDRGPGYAGNFDEGSELRALRTERLVRGLDAAVRTSGSADDGSGDVLIPPKMDHALICHLAEAWGRIKTRAHSREASHEPMKIAVGMRSTHFFLSGGVEFADLLAAESLVSKLEVNPFLRDDVQFVKQAEEKVDVWANAFDAGGGRIPENPHILNPEASLFAPDPRPPSEPSETYLHYDTTTVDMSPAGYRLRWSEPSPPSLQAGELVGLRDETDPRWCVAVVRWIRQNDDGLFMGIELLAPQATPVAVRLIHTRGSTAEYQRAFLLPALRPVGQPASLVLPSSPFETGQKIHLLEGATQNTAQLGECLLGTESFNRFTFRLLDGYLETTGNQRTMGNTGQFNDRKRSGFR